MTDDTHKTSEAVGGVEGAKLEVKNLALSDATQVFNTTAQVRPFKGYIRLPPKTSIT